MSQVYTSIIGSVIANTFLLGSFGKPALRWKIFYDAQQSLDPLFIYLLISLLVYFFSFIYLIFFYFIDFIQPRRQVLEFSRTHLALFLTQSITFSVVDADWLNTLRRFPIS